MCEKHICLQEDVNQIGDIPYGKGYDLCKKEFSNTFDQIARMGYGLVFISHSTEKKFKDEKGEEYIQLAPALPQRPYDIINKMVDFIGYIRVKKDPTTGQFIHKIFFRGDDNFLAGSRFKYIEPVVDFSYDAVVKAVVKAIDKQVEESGGEATNDINVFYQKQEEFNFDSLMNEARTLWDKVVGTDRNQAIKMKAIIKEIFGKDIKISTVEPNQVQLLAELVNRMKAMV